MKLKKRIGAFLLAGAMMTSVGSQAFAYSWSGYLGDNKWTSVAGLKTKTTSSATAAKVTWSSTENKSKGCKVEVYNDGGTRVAYGTLRYGSTVSLSGNTAKNKNYSMKARTVSDTDVGIYNGGSWNP